MKKYLSLLLGLLVFSPLFSQKQPPLAAVKVVTEDYCGQKVDDPYRYLEDLQNPDVDAWYRAQGDYARSVLNAIPGRKALLDKMRDFDGRKAVKINQLTITENDRYFYLKQTPADENGKLFFRDGFSGAEQMLFDPSAYAPGNGKNYVISSMSPNDDGSKIAFEVSPNGSESSVLLVMDVAAKRLSAEQFDRCWFASPSWLPDGTSFLYNRLNSADVHDKEREKNSKTWLHVVGTNPVEDREIFSRQHNPALGINPEDIPVIQYDKDSRKMFGFAYTVDRHLKAWIAPASDLGKDDIDWKPLFKKEDEVLWFEASDKDLYLYSSKKAPNFQLLKTSVEHPDPATAQVVIPENKNETLTGFALSSNGLYYTLSKNGVQATAYRLDEKSGKTQELKLPFAAGSAWFSTKGYRYDDVWAGLSGWTSDFQRYRYTPANGQFKAENLSSTAQYPEYADLQVEEVMATGHDGALIPLSLIYKKGLKLDGNNAVFIFGYGAYGASMNPFFSPEFLLWTHEGGILAVAHVRGGGEMGDNWHMAGYKKTKPNTWKDLISCAEYLVGKKYTTAGKIAINSTSAGGILIGRAMTERPDLFAVAVPEVGCLNPLRAEFSPNGPINVPEFGSIKNEEECKALIEMDAYLHIRDGQQYPATLITAGMNDPRVIAWQPGKFAARLQAANTSGKPVLLWADYEAGHGIGDSKTKSFESLADVLGFAFWQTGNPRFQTP